MHIWIDTDVGHNPDDAIALLAAAAHPGVELAGVSTVGEDPERGAEITRRLLGSAGHPDVPVVAGPPAEYTATGLLAIGPLTNLAARRDRLPEAVTVMGGVLNPVHHRGELRRVEHNVGHDPRAAAAVLTRRRLTLVPLDVTVGTRLTHAQTEALVVAAPILGPMVEAWRAGLAERGVPVEDRVVHLHDPAALLTAAADPAAGVRTEAVRLSVEIDGRLTAGGATGAVHDVVVGLDAAGVATRVLELLGGTATPDGQRGGERSIP